MRKNKFDTPWDSDYWMKSNGFYCGFNMPEALNSKEGEGEEVLQSLPPYRWRKSYLVDEYPACPENWMRSKGSVTSYTVPIQEGKGMWLDFNKNWDRKHDVAIVVSVQGVNAITGLPCKDAHLEQYVEKCPKHDKAFGPDRLCEDCGYKWPKQNYLATTSTEYGQLWIDGFRAANGAVQQYILTEKESRGVASNIIGDDRVFAVGVSFFLSKNEKPKQRDWSNIVLGQLGQPAFFSPIHTPLNWQQGPSESSSEDSIDCNGQWNYGGVVFDGTSSGWQNRASDAFDNTCYTARVDDEPEQIIEKQLESTKNDSGKSITCHHSFDTGVLRTSAVTTKGPQLIRRRGAVPEGLIEEYHVSPVKTKSMEVGAGASIRQQVEDDTEPLDYWRDKPEAILCINYCLENEMKEILSQGKVSKQGDPQGFLKEVPVGN